MPLQNRPPKASILNMNTWLRLADKFQDGSIRHSSYA